MTQVVVVHCSDTPNGRHHTAEEIHQWHLANGWDGIGYHYVIQLDGTVEAGRPHYWKGSHCRGMNDNIGICLIGRDKFTKQQEVALWTLLDKLEAEPTGHYIYDSGKTCPNFDVTEWYKLREEWPLL